MSSSYTIRNVKSAAELRTRIARAYELEEWNTCADDCEAFFALDPNAFFVGEINGEPVSFISAIKYNTLSFLGLYYVEPKFRGMNLGRTIWNKAWERVSDQTISLDGVETMVDKYETMGFKKFYPFSGYRFGTSQFANLTPCSKIETPINMQEVIAYDKKIFGQDRTALLTVWCKTNAVSFIVKDEEGEICGLSWLRKACEGYRISLYANSYQTALDLIIANCKTLQDTTIDIDLPHQNPGAMELLKNFKMEWVDNVTRMMRPHNGDAIPALQIDQIYGISSWEIG